MALHHKRLYSCNCCSLAFTLTYLLHGAEFFLRSSPVLRKSRNYPCCMEPEGSLSRLQVSATFPNPQPDQSSPCPYIPPSEDPSYYYPPIYAWVIQVVSFPKVSPPKPCIHFFSPLYLLHTLPISFFSI